MENNTKKSKKTVKLQDIADRCGISKMAVSLALRNNASISDATKQQVKLIAAELGYHLGMHDAARRLTAHKTGQRIRTNTIGVILPPTFLKSVLSGTIFQAILDSAVPAGFAVLVTYYNFTSLQSYLENPVVPLPPVFAMGGVDGLILFDISKNVADTVSYLEKNSEGTHNPVVVIMGDNNKYSSVNFDHWHGNYILTKHLLDMGHKDILRFYNPKEKNIFHTRIQASYQALAEYGLTPDHLHFIEMPMEWINQEMNISFNEITGLDYYQEKLLHELQTHPEITAIMAWNDSSAVNTCNILNKAGINIPGDISVTGYDDIYPYINIFGENELTTTRVQFRELGSNAMNTLIDHINNQTVNPVHKTLKPEIIIRKTSGPVKIKAL